MNEEVGQLQSGSSASRLCTLFLAIIVLERGGSCSREACSGT